MKRFVKSNAWLKDILKQDMKNAKLGFLSIMEMGWGNGYVVIPPTHPWWNMDIDKIPVYVHGGLTYGSIITEEMINEIWADYLDESDLGHYLVGFDTNHHADDEHKWPRSAVEAETEDLHRQIITLNKTIFIH